MSCRCFSISSIVHNDFSLFIEFSEVLVADDANNSRHVRRKFTTTKFTTKKISRLFLKLCGVPESSSNTAVDISIESRKSFLTETSELTENINMGLAITLLFIVTFLVGYYH